MTTKNDGLGDLFGSLFGNRLDSAYRIVKCVGCGQKNRVMIAMIAQNKIPNCGKCKLPIPWSQVK